MINILKPIGNSAVIRVKIGRIGYRSGIRIRNPAIASRIGIQGISPVPVSAGYRLLTVIYTVTVCVSIIWIAAKYYLHAVGKSVTVHVYVIRATPRRRVGLPCIKLAVMVYIFISLHHT